MFSNYLKVAFRSIMKHKGFAFINIAGLMIGLTACILIVLWVVDELGYDRFNTKAERIYRATWNARYGDNEWNIPLVPVPLGPTLEKEFPEVERTVRFRTGGMTLRNNEHFQREEGVLFVEKSFFDVFSVDFLAGNPAAALADPHSIVLTEETARRYFGRENPLGQTLEMNDGTVLNVSGLVKGFPLQSHVHFDFLAPLKMLPIVEQRKTQWGSATVYTYVLLREGEDVSALAEKLDQYVQRVVVGDNFAGTSNFAHFPLTPLLDLHLRSHLRYELESNGNITSVYVFSVVALFILVLACINFVNLSTARSMNRAREVGMRKVLGSARAQLIRQFFAETFLHVAIAMAGAMILTELLLPSFNEFSGKDLSSVFLLTPYTAWVLAVVAVTITILAGAYPALLLSSFLPVDVLKGGVQFQSKSRIRKILVVIQFLISIVLVAGTLVVQQQLHYVQSKNLGYDKEQVLVIHRASALGTRAAAFRERLVAESAVVDAAAAQYLPGQIFDSTVFTLEQPANYQNTSVTYDMVDPQFADVLKLNVIAGRNFSPKLATDSSAFLINQSAAKAFGWDKPVGKTIEMGGGFVRGPVIGVVEDFHFESLHHEVKPMVLMWIRWRPSSVAVRLHAGRIQEGLSVVEKLWNEFVPNTPFSFSFLDEDYQRLYEAEQRVEQVFAMFSSLAVAIACLGLFGLASFITEQRRKEIGIRKTLGATAYSIVGLLLREFGILILISFGLAVPIAYVAMERWLQDFAYRTTIGWEVFALAGGITILVTLFSVGIQSLKASRTNPVDALKYE